jgi:beta-lactamase class A
MTPASLFMLAAFAVLPTQAPARTPARAAATLQQAVARLTAGFQGKVSVYAKNLDTGAEFAMGADDRVRTASTIKLPILCALSAQVAAGRLKWDDRVPLHDADKVSGSGVVSELSDGTALSLRELSNLMIVVSDNTATNVLIELLGMDAVTARMRRLGLKDTRLRRYMIDLEAAKRGNENVSSPGDIARLLETFHRGTGLTPASRDEALKILKKEKVPLSALAKGLPAGIEVANKPGELEGVRVDAGIVYAKNRPYIFSAMTSFLLEDEAGDRAVEELSRVAYGYFSRIGAGSEYGRQIGR